MEIDDLDGAAILSNLHSPDGHLTHMPNEQGNTLEKLTIETVLKHFANSANGPSFAPAFGRFMLSAT